MNNFYIPAAHKEQINKLVKVYNEWCKQRNIESQLIIQDQYIQVKNFNLVQEVIRKEREEMARTEQVVSEYTLIGCIFDNGVIRLTDALPKSVIKEAFGITLHNSERSKDTALEYRDDR